MACGAAQSTGSPTDLPSLPRQVPGGCTSDWSWVSTSPVVANSMPVRPVDCTPQRSIRSPLCQPASLGLIAPTVNRPKGSK